MAGRSIQKWDCTGIVCISWYQTFVGHMLVCSAGVVCCSCPQASCLISILCCTCVSDMRGHEGDFHRLTAGLHQTSHVSYLHKMPIHATSASRAPVLVWTAHHTMLNVWRFYFSRIFSLRLFAYRRGFGVILFTPKR